MGFHGEVNLRVVSIKVRQQVVVPNDFRYWCRIDRKQLRTKYRTLRNPIRKGASRWRRTINVDSLNSVTHIRFKPLTYKCKVGQMLSSKWAGYRVNVLFCSNSNRFSNCRTCKHLSGVKNIVIVLVVACSLWRFQLFSGRLQLSVVCSWQMWRKCVFYIHQLQVILDWMSNLTITFPRLMAGYKQCCQIKNFKMCLRIILAV